MSGDTDQTPAAPFTRSPHRKCLRGLHWVYTYEPALDPDTLAGALEAAFEGRLVRGEEAYGAVRVIRLILQFVVEFRVGERPGQLSLIHRMTSKPSARRHSEQTLEGVLRALT